MSKITTIVDNIIAKVNEHTNVASSHINLSGITAYHLLQGNLSVSNEIITNGFSTTLYTGNGGTQSINTGINMATQWGDDASETYGGLYWGKSRSVTAGHLLADSVNGATKYLQTNTTAALTTDVSTVTAFTSTGVSLGSNGTLNTNASTNVGWNFQTTHRKTGITNHGKTYTEHYNPFTGFTIIKYEGSGLAGHEIPHSLGRKLGLIIAKDLSAAINWWVNTDSGYMHLNTTYLNTTGLSESTDSNVTLNSTTGYRNTATNQYIMYGWANSYFDSDNKLIGNYEVGVYQGTGVAGNKVKTRGKPAWIMVKRLDVADEWTIFDNKRAGGALFPNISRVESSGWTTTYNSDGFTINNVDANVNASGGQYLYMVVYDNDSGSGKSKYYKATDTANVQINNGIIPLAHGIDSNGSKNSIVVKNETITGLTYTQGKNYLYKTDTGYGVKPYKPRCLASELVRSFVGEQPDYYDVESNKWFNCDAGAELVTNGTFNVNTNGWTAVNSTLSISNGSLAITNVGTNYGMGTQAINTTIGKKYTLKISVDSGTSNSSFDLINGAITTRLANEVSGHYEFSVDFIAQATSITLVPINASNVAGKVSYVQNITMFAYDITPTTEITESRNYMNHIVHADADGGVLYVEELPKIEYKNVVKAEEYLGKNACTAWVNFDGTTTPPTIRDSYNVSAVIRTTTGQYDIYFKEIMDNSNYTSVIDFFRPTTWANSGSQIYMQSINKCALNCVENSTGANSLYIKLQIFGGRN